MVAEGGINGGHGACTYLPLDTMLTVVEVLEHEVQDGLAVLLHLSFVDDGDGKNREKSALSVCLRVNRFVARSTLTCSTERSFTT